ncbi:MAG: hypothetical protein K1X67_05305 [Fimbriimonadaceae bacterium]|nr:hypothetical protein [Fimbriimonadaceae bacterium]
MDSRMQRTPEAEAEFLLLRERVRQWKAGMDELNRLEFEVARSRTPAERFRNHQAFLEGDAQLGLSRAKPDDYVHRTPYHEIQERWLARHPQRLLGH